MLKRRVNRLSVCNRLSSAALHFCGLQTVDEQTDSCCGFNSMRVCAHMRVTARTICLSVC